MKPMKNILYVCLLSVCIVFTVNVKVLCADAWIKVINTTGGGNVTMKVRNVSDDQPAEDGIIRWLNINVGHTKWKIAEQYLEVTYEQLPVGWGIQIYTDNKNEQADPRYTGKTNPAGLVKISDTAASTIPMSWRITDTKLAGHQLDDPVEAPSYRQFVDGLWHYMKDKNTPDDPSTPENEAFVNGDDYVTIWDPSGIAWGAKGRGHNPKKAYFYLAARFSGVTVSSEYKTTMLTIEAFRDLLHFPFYLYKDGAPALAVAYDYIISKMNKFFSGDEMRLIESYSPPYPPRAGNPSEDLHDIAFVYDNTAAICALLSNPTDVNRAQAKLLCKSLIWAQAHDPRDDGRLRDAYWASLEFHGSTPPLIGGNFNSSSAGNIAWAIITWLQYYKNSGDEDIEFKQELVSASEDAGNFIYTNFYDSTPPYVGYYVGYDQNDVLNTAKSTESNTAIYIAFAHLYDITGNSYWLTRAQQAKDFVTSTAWRPGEGRFLCGVNADGTLCTNILVSDANLLPILAIGTLATYNPAINYVTSHFYYTYENFIGVDFGYVAGASGEPDGIWSEGTALLASAYKIAGFYGYPNNSAAYLESLKLIQGQAKNADYKGVVSTPNDVITTGLGWSYYPSVHLGATAWFITANRNYNIYWGTAMTEPVPVPGENRTFNAAIYQPSLEYLKNRYVPAGWLNAASWTSHMSVDDRCTESSYSGDYSFKLSWNGLPGADGYRWGGIMWLEPEDIWVYQGQHPTHNGYDLRGSDYMTFWAKTDPPNDGLVVRTWVGNTWDSCGEFDGGNYGFITLTTSWQQYSILVGPHDMSNVTGGFGITFDAYHDPDPDGCDIYLDDIQFSRD